MLRIVLVRHGETEWNQQHRLQGRSDIPLAEVGVEQARTTGGIIRGQNPQAAHVSTLCRTQQTFAEFGLDLNPTVWNELCEQGFGPWEGLSAPDIREQFPDQFDAWRAGGYAPEGAETLEQLTQRMRTAFFSIVRGTAEIEPSPSIDLSFDLRTAVVVSHGAALRVLFESLGLIDRKWIIPLTPAAVTIIDVLAGPDASDELIRNLTDEQIQEKSRLRTFNLSPTLLAPALVEPPAATVG